MLDKDKRIVPHREMEAKLHPGLLAVYECWVKKNPNCGNVQNGRLAIQVWLTESSPAVMKELKRLGFVVSPGKPGEAQIHGTLPVEKLQMLAQIK
jgi:hypothetical protein